MKDIEQYLEKVCLPDPYSHKGQNGKLLLIGGSILFHAASKWSLDVASKFVDMVIYSSVSSNNDLIQEAKKDFWNGIVVKREDIESYIEEADVILIGPGMERAEPYLLQLKPEELERKLSQKLSADDWDEDTELVTNYLLHKYPKKKWVIDAGALQMVVPDLLTNTTIITPHKGELERLQGMIEHRAKSLGESETNSFETLIKQGVTIVLKGPIDYVYVGNEVVEVKGGNPGMTKGGTGDVLAGLIAALYATNEKDVSAVVGSYINKKAGERLAETVGPFFNASDLVEMVPKVLWEELKSKK